MRNAEPVVEMFKKILYCMECNYTILNVLRTNNYHISIIIP